jgi:hypothetical protein
LSPRSARGGVPVAAVVVAVVDGGAIGSGEAVVGGTTFASGTGGIGVGVIVAAIPGAAAWLGGSAAGGVARHREEVTPMTAGGGSARGRDSTNAPASTMRAVAATPP